MPTYYHTRLVQGRIDGRCVWTASHPRLPGCHAVGMDPQEAVGELATVREEWLTRARESSERIPAGQTDPSFELVFEHEHTAADEEAAREALLTAADPTVWLGVDPGSTTGQF